MKKIEMFIDENFNEFNDLTCSEVIEMGVNEFDSEIVEHLKNNYRFDYRGICVYYVEEKNEIWIENNNMFMGLNN